MSVSGVVAYVGRKLVLVVGRVGVHGRLFDGLRRNFGGERMVKLDRRLVMGGRVFGGELLVDGWGGLGEVECLAAGGILLATSDIGLRECGRCSSGRCEVRIGGGGGNVG